MSSEPPMSLESVLGTSENEAEQVERLKKELEAAERQIKELQEALSNMQIELQELRSYKINVEEKRREAEKRLHGKRHLGEYAKTRR